MDIMLFCPDEPSHRQVTRYDLDKLLAADDGLREDEATIRETLARGETYHGGGGAAPAFEIRPLRTFKVHVQRFVEQVCTVEVVAQHELQARDMAYQSDLTAAAWEEGDDVNGLRVYAVEDEESGRIEWEA